MILKYLSAILIPILGVIVYSNSFHCSFHFDDYFFIVKNDAIRDLQHIGAIWNFLPCRFIFYLSLALNYHWGHQEVFGYHLFNLSVHLISALLVWWLTLLTLSTPVLKGDKINQEASWIALFTGLIFVSHPIQTQGVTYIMQRAASLASMFYLAALCFYVKSRLLGESVKRPNIVDSAELSSNVIARSMATKQSLNKIAASPMAPRNDMIKNLYYLGSLIATVLAMFTKEIAITLPLIVTLYELSFFKTKKAFNWNSVNPFLFTLFIIPITMYLTKAGNAPSTIDMQRALKGTVGITSGQYLLTQGNVIMTYIRLLFLPIHQNVDYDYPIAQSLFEWPTILSFSVLMGILWASKVLFSKYRLLSVGIFWFFITLLPESSIFPIKDVIFEHRLYLPMVGYCFFLVGALYYVVGQRSIPVMIIILSLIVGVNSYLTYERNKVWQDDFTLWNDAIKKSPHKARPYNNRGGVYLNEGKIDLALADFNKALANDPQYEESYNNRGDLYSRQGKFDLAMADFDRAIELNPNSPTFYYNRGSTLDKQGNFPQALIDLNKAIELNPAYADAYNNRGNVYFKQGDWSAAISDFNKTLEIDPGYVDVYNNRGNAYFKAGDLTQALVDYNKSIELNSKGAEAYDNRGNFYYKQGNYLQAIADFTQAIIINPKDTQAYTDRGNSYDNEGNLLQALSDYNRAIQIDPRYAEGYANRAVVYAKQNNLTAAMSDYNKAIELNPKYEEAYASRGVIFAEQNNLTQAMADYTRAIELNSNDADAYYNRGVSYYQLKEYDKAWEDERRAENLGYTVNPNFIAALKQATRK